MFKEVKRDDAIFKSEAVLKDEIAYSIMFSILNNAERYKTPKIFSDGKDCTIVNFFGFSITVFRAFMLFVQLIYSFLYTLKLCP